MRSLRTSLLQQIVSYNSRYKSGANENDVAEPAWIYWKELCFLRPFIKTRKGPDNLSLTSTTTSQSPEEEKGDLKALLTSIGAITEETAEAVAASPRVYQETPSPKAPDLAKKKRSDTPSPAQQAVEILKDMQTASEERRKKATYNELFFQMVARAMEDFPKDIQHQLQFDIFKMIHETRVKLLNTK
ncbi:hypothetical protein C0Q70_16955 [Pomacea canaliculata]|uniref:Uncharacterized protein n=2 Tax=Pomacea canaliculata TaxID=400727 RepID=A0A2T7NRA9_POMCA|nr:hypothetical protein C0Q70_16955 [Pomacea canaliculata]